MIERRATVSGPRLRASGLGCRIAVFLLTSLLLPVASAGPTAEGTADPPGEPSRAAVPPHVGGLVVRVVDVDEALDFYAETAGFEITDRSHYPELVALRNGPVELYLLKVARPARHEYPGSSEAHLNIQVEDLEATLADLERRSVPRLAPEPRMAAVGPNMPILDPSGNILYVLQYRGHQGELPRPRVFNYGITITDMAVARAHYETILGFDVFSEDYYPPVIPFEKAGTVSVVLHETATVRSPTPGSDVAQMNLVFLVDDLEAAVDRLTSSGVEIRPAPPALGPLGAAAELIDPCGNVNLIVAKAAATMDAGDRPEHPTGPTAARRVKTP